MAQHDQVIDDGPGLSVRTDVNAALAALFSSSSGNVAPTVTVPGQLWFDTSIGGVTNLKVRDIANASWVSLSLAASGGGDQTIAANYILNRPTITPGLAFSGSFGGLMRWKIFPGDTSAESTGNAGSNFAIQRFSDAGAAIDTPFTITRSSGRVNATLGLTVAGGLIADSLDLTTPLAVADGGTGGTTQAAGRTGLGLGTMAVQNTTNYYTAATVDAKIAAGIGNPDFGVTAVGAMVLAAYTGSTNLNPGDTVAGSLLRPTNIAGMNSGAARTGTWRCLGSVWATSGATAASKTTLFQRIA